MAQKKAAADAAASVMTACAAEVQLADKEAVAAAAMSAADLAKGPFPGAKFFRSDLTASTQRESNTRARGSKAATARTASAASATESAFRRKESHAAAAAYEEPVTFPQLAQHSLYKKKAGRETEAALLQLSPAVRQKFAREAGSVTMATVTGSVGDAAPTPPGTARTASAARLLRVTCWVFLVSLAVVCAEVYLLLSYVRLFPEDASSAQPPKQLLLGAAQVAPQLGLDIVLHIPGGPLVAGAAGSALQLLAAAGGLLPSPLHDAVIRALTVARSNAVLLWGSFVLTALIMAAKGVLAPRGQGRLLYHQAVPDENRRP